jgi:hypothetical protein
MNYLTCVLCGTASRDVATGILAWKEPIGREIFTAAPRCKDRAACRSRVEANGDEWDLLEKPRDTRDLIEGRP